MFTPSLWTARQTRLGEPLRAWRQERCSCFDAQRQAWDRSHAVCGGTGTIMTEMSISSYLALVSNAGMDLEFKSGGRIWKNDLVLETKPAEIPLTEGDEVQLQKATRKTHVTETLRRGVVDRTYQEIISISTVRRNSTVYIATTDYSFSGNLLSWVTGQGPTAGQTYAVEYWGRPRYTVYEYKVRGDAGVTQSVLARIKQPENVSLGVAGV